MRQKKLSGEILKSETLPYNDHSQRIIDFLKEKMDFFELSQSKVLFDYNGNPQLDRVD